MSPTPADPPARTWTFLTNHAHVLVCIAEEPDIRGRDIATRVGITERSAQAIIADLVAEGYVTRTRIGRRNVRRRRGSRWWGVRCRGRPA